MKNRKPGCEYIRSSVFRCCIRLSNVSKSASAAALELPIALYLNISFAIYLLTAHPLLWFWFLCMYALLSIIVDSMLLFEHSDFSTEQFFQNLFLIIRRIVGGICDTYNSADNLNFVTAVLLLIWNLRIN